MIKMEPQEKYVVFSALTNAQSVLTFGKLCKVGNNSDTFGRLASTMAQQHISRILVTVTQNHRCISIAMSAKLYITCR